MSTCSTIVYCIVNKYIISDSNPHVFHWSVVTSNWCYRALTLLGSSAQTPPSILSSWTILGQSRDHFGTILGPFRDHFGTILGLFWDHFGTILGPFLDPYFFLPILTYYDLWGPIVTCEDLF